MAAATESILELIVAEDEAAFSDLAEICTESSDIWTEMTESLPDDSVRLQAFSEILFIINRIFSMKILNQLARSPISSRLLIFNRLVRSPSPSATSRRPDTTAVMGLISCFDKMMASGRMKAMHTTNTMTRYLII